MLEMKSSINKINTVESISGRQYQAEEETSWMEDKIKEILYSDKNKEKK
jgi:hypothetical protein